MTRFRPSSFGVRTRLLVLALVPALLLATIGGTAIVRQSRAERTLADIREEVAVLSQLTELRRALLGSRAPVELEVRARAVGLDRAAAVRLLGIGDLELEDLDDAMARLQALPEEARPFEIDRLESLQQGSASEPDVRLIDQFDELDALARQRWEQRLIGLRDRVVDTGSAELNQRLDDLEASTRAGSAAGAMVTKLADYWFGTIAENDRTGPARTAIAVADGQFDLAMGELSASNDPVVARTAQQIVDDLPTSPFGEAVDDAVAARPPAPLQGGVDVDGVAATFRSSFDLFQIGRAHV